VKILLDECLPKRLKSEIIGHEVHTAQEMGWAGKSNGTLLALIEKEFEVFITADRNIAFQQNTDKLKILVVVLHAKTNQFRDLKSLVPPVLKRLSTTTSGQTGVVTIP
jgi:hypothetical protein